jgi:hypothetical protein
MTCYTLYLYNKDRDTYSQGYVVSTEEQARTIAEAVSTLLKQDMIIDREDNNEPFDWVEIIKYSDDNVNPTGDRVAVYPEE